jgi:hypothetical protein
VATKTEIERLSVVETKVDAIGTDVKEIKDTLITEVKAINVRFDNLDNKYASKWVQSAVAFVIGLIVAAVITALVALVVGPLRGTSDQGVTPPTTSNTTTTTTPTGSTSTTNTSDTVKDTSTANNTTKETETTNDSSSGGLLNVVPKVTP